MVQDNVSQLGPQCLSCKKRRVKCDSATPRCTRCQRDNIECPGYTKRLRWTHYCSSSDRDCGKPTSFTTSNTTVISSTQAKTDDPALKVTPRRFPDSVEARECRLLLESSQYYNDFMLPEAVPAHLPFRRGDLQAAHWTKAPSIIRNLMLLFVKSNQVRRAGGREDLSPEVCAYRSRSLTDIKESLSVAANEPYGIALSGVLLLMGIEILNPGFGHFNWMHHFKASRQIINLRGGFAKCFFDLPHAQSLLTKYMILDVFSSTTCCISELDITSIQAQARYGPITLLREKSLLEAGFSCPQPLMQAIIDTNILRWTLQARHKSRLDIDHSRKYEDVLANILRFDPEPWAQRTARYGLVLPLRVGEVPSSAVSEAWRALAESHKQAAMLYCMLSLRAPTFDEEKELITNIQSSLARQLQSLFNLATSDPDGPIETQLWKFCLWPVVISTYVSICWCCCECQEMTGELMQLHTTANALGNSPLMRSWAVLSDIAAKRSDFSGTWKWNDGFSARRAFVAC